MIQAVMSGVQFQMRSVNLFSNLSNYSSRTVSLGSTQSLTEESSGYLNGSKARPKRKAIFTAICELIF
jgi:hypothetical protein